MDKVADGHDMFTQLRELRRIICRADLPKASSVSPRRTFMLTGLSQKELQIFGENRWENPNPAHYYSFYER